VPTSIAYLANYREDTATRFSSFAKRFSSFATRLMVTAAVFGYESVANVIDYVFSGR
jgi:hypothetical protein